MKKKICLLLTLIISIVMFSGRVEAAKELTCICKDTALSPTHYMIVQNFNGEQFFFVNYYGDATIDDPEWYNPTGDGYVVEAKYTTTKYNSGVLSGCPNYAQDFKFTSRNHGSIYTFYFSDEKYAFKDDHACVQYNRLPDLDVYVSFTSNKIDEYNQIIQNNEWSGQCEYNASDDDDKITLYFNHDRYLLINESDLIYSSTARFTLKQLWDLVNDLNVCPVRLYEVNALPTANLTNNFYMNYYLDNSEGGREYSCVGSTCGNSIGPVKPEEPTIVIDDCGDLFGEDLVKKINDFMDIIKIVVPILLIVFGIIDFMKAVFSAKEDEMSKNQKTFFNRLLAAILVFIAPIFINLILSLANEVWSNITPDTCIQYDK